MKMILKLKEKGYRFISVSSAKEAIQYARKHRIDKAVLDTQFKNIKDHMIIPLYFQEILESICK